MLSMAVVIVKLLSPGGAAVGGFARVQDGYVSSGTSGHARPLRELKNRSVSRENVLARARKWTGVPLLVLPS